MTIPTPNSKCATRDRCRPYWASIATLLLIIGTNFGAEALVYILLPLLPSLPAWLAKLLHGLVLIGVLCPLIYFCSLRPLLKQIRRRQQAEEALRAANENLEARIQLRTAELQAVNQSLQIEIAQRKQSEAALAEQSRFLEAFFQHSLNPLVFLDQDCRILRVNQAYAKPWELDTQEFLGRSCFDFCPGIEARAEFQAVIRTRTPCQVEAAPFTHANHPEWGVQYWDWTLVPVMNVGGTVDFLFLSLKEVTASERAEAELRAASLYTRSLIEANLDPMVTISTEGKITDVNKATESATGVSRDRLLGSDFAGYFTEPLQVKTGLQKVITTGFVKDFPLTLRHTSGATTEALCNATVYRGANGQIQGVFATARDISTLKAAEKRRNFTNTLLELFARKSSCKEYLDSVVEVIRDWSSCEALGIRIMAEEEIPYESSAGFKPAFLALENRLSLRLDHCLCVRAIAPHLEDSDVALQTPGGSFRCDNVPAFIRQLPLERQAYYRGNCLKFGFNSLAIIPIRYRTQTLGVIHLVDRRPNHFPQETVEFIEAMTPLIGEAVHRFQAEAALHQANQTLRMMSECNQALVHFDTEPKLIREVCRLIRKLGGYQRAWVGLAKDDPAKSIMPIAAFGCEAGFLERVQTTWAESEANDHPMNRAIRTGQVQVSDLLAPGPEPAPWKEEALRHGLHAAIALPLIVQGRAQHALMLYSNHANAFGPKAVQLLRDLVTDLALGVTTIRVRTERDRVQRELEKKAAQLRRLACELTQAEQREQRRLAQVLHDHLQQLLASARFNLEVLGNRCPTPEVQPSIARLDDVLCKAIETCHTLTCELSPPILYEAGLNAALAWLARWMQEKHGLSVCVEKGAEFALEDDQAIILLYQSVRELLFNIVKHSGVKEARVRVSLEKRARIRIVVQDKGRGFDPIQIQKNEDAAGGFGLFNIRERLDLLGGSLDIQSAPGRGSRFTLLLPLKLREGVGKVSAPASLGAPPTSQNTAAPQAQAVAEEAVKPLTQLIEA